MPRPSTSRAASPAPHVTRPPLRHGTTLARYTMDGVRFLVLTAPVPLPPGCPATLTLAERAVFMLLARGLSNRELASSRGCSVPTVAKQVAAIKRKLGCPDRHALVTLARQLQITQRHLAPTQEVREWRRGASS